MENKRLLLSFFIIYAIYALALTIEFKFIFTDEFYNEIVKESNKPIQEITELIKKDKAQKWINYPYVLLVIFVPTIATTLILYLGAIVKEHKLKLKSIFRISLESHIVFSVSYFIVIVFKSSKLLEYSPSKVNDWFELQSVLNFFKKTEIPIWLHYPLQCLNITELLYVFVLAYGYSKISHSKYIKSLRWVAIVYVLGLTFWIILTIFINMVL